MQRRISLSVRPSARRFSTYSRVSPSWVILTIATMCKALFRDRSPPRFNRCRTVFPEDAGIGFTPAGRQMLPRYGPCLRATTRRGTLQR